MLRALIPCGAFLLALSLQAGTVLYNNTGTTPGSTDFLYVQIDGPLYNSFSTGSNPGEMSDLKLELGLGATGLLGSFSIGLYADSNIHPGSLMGTFGTVYDTSLTTTPTLYDFSLPEVINLYADTRYWIGLVSNNSNPLLWTAAQWYYASTLTGTGVAGEYNFSGLNGVNPNSLPFSAYFGPFMMEVGLGGGTPPIPEPATFFLAAPALAALALVRRRRAID